jgi:SAM-dependent methyltransferase
MFHVWKVRALKRRRVNYWWRYWRSWRGEPVGNYQQLPDLIRRWAPGRSFADVGCIWGVNGEHAFIAEAAGATVVKAIDVFGPTPEFDAHHRARNSRVEFILGDITAPSTIARVGAVDVVLCAGVLYHHPSPFDVLVALRRICRQTLILRTSTIPEVHGLPNAAVFFPMLDDRARRLWDLRSLGVGHQTGITNPYRPEDGYGNWFWGLTPSCLVSLVACAGFQIEHRATEPFAQTVIARAITSPFEHHLPGEAEARQMGASISRSGIAQPA